MDVGLIKMKKILLFPLILIGLLAGNVSAIAAPQSLWGKIYDDKNVAISGVQVIVTQSGKSIATPVPVAAEGATAPMEGVRSVREPEKLK